MTPEKARMNADALVHRALDNRTNTPADIQSMATLALSLYACADTMEMIAFRSDTNPPGTITLPIPPELRVCGMRFGVAQCERSPSHAGAHKEGTVVWGHEPADGPTGDGDADLDAAARRYPPHHHEYGRPGYVCPICLTTGVVAYAIQGAQPIYAADDRKWAPPCQAENRIPNGVTLFCGRDKDHPGDHRSGVEWWTA